METHCLRNVITFFMIILPLLYISAQKTAGAETAVASSSLDPTPILSGSTGSAPAVQFKDVSEKIQQPGFWGWLAVAVLILRMISGLPVSASGWKWWMGKKQNRE